MNPHHLPVRRIEAAPDRERGSQFPQGGEAGGFRGEPSGRRGTEEGDEHRRIDAKTLTRNWNELLQELRVAQTGIQVLTGFLLTVPFSSRFEELETREVTIYLLVLSGSVLTTALVTAPVAFHRILFRRREREWLVEAANVSARAGLTSMAVTSSGVLLLVFDVVVSFAAGLTALAVSLAQFVAICGAVPWWSRQAGGRDDQ